MTIIQSTLISPSQPPALDILGIPSSDEFLVLRADGSVSSFSLTSSLTHNSTTTFAVPAGESLRGFVRDHRTAALTCGAVLTSTSLVSLDTGHVQTLGGNHFRAAEILRDGTLVLLDDFGGFQIGDRKFPEISVLFFAVAKTDVLLFTKDRAILVNIAQQEISSEIPLSFLPSAAFVQASGEVCIFDEYGGLHKLGATEVTRVGVEISRCVEISGGRVVALTTMGKLMEITSGGIRHLLGGGEEGGAFVEISEASETPVAFFRGGALNFPRAVRQFEILGRTRLSDRVLEIFDVSTEDGEARALITAATGGAVVLKEVGRGEWGVEGTAGHQGERILVATTNLRIREGGVDVAVESGGEWKAVYTPTGGVRVVEGVGEGGTVVLVLGEGVLRGRARVVVLEVTERGAVEKNRRDFDKEVRQMVVVRGEIVLGLRGEGGSRLTVLDALSLATKAHLEVGGVVESLATTGESLVVGFSDGRVVVVERGREMEARSLDLGSKPVKVSKTGRLASGGRAVLIGGECVFEMLERNFQTATKIGGIWFLVAREEPNVVLWGVEKKSLVRETHGLKIAESFQNDAQHFLLTLNRQNQMTIYSNQTPIYSLSAVNTCACMHGKFFFVRQQRLSICSLISPRELVEEASAPVLGSSFRVLVSDQSSNIYLVRNYKNKVYITEFVSSLIVKQEVLVDGVTNEILYAEICQSRLFLGISNSLYLFSLSSLKLIAKHAHLPALITCGCAISDHAVFLGLLSGGWTILTLDSANLVDFDLGNFIHVAASNHSFQGSSSDILVHARLRSATRVVFATITGHIKLVELLLPDSIPSELIQKLRSLAVSHQTDLTQVLEIDDALIDQHPDFNLARLV